MSENPSAVRSRRLITSALLELMAEKPLSRIAVGEVCARAELTRPTFYNHFSSKEDVLAGVIDELFDRFVSSLDKECLSSTDTLVRAYFQFWQKRRELLELFNDNNLFSLMGDRFASYLNEIYAIIPFRNGSISPDELVYHNVFLSSGMAGMLKHWARAGMKPDADEVTAYISHALAVLQAGSAGANVNANGSARGSTTERVPPPASEPASAPASDPASVSATEPTSAPASQPAQQPARMRSSANSPEKKGE